MNNMEEKNSKFMKSFLNHFNCVVETVTAVHVD